MEELKYAKSILKIAETQNISKAAQDLFISQPALSRVLHQVETSLGFPIFDRHTMPLKPTEKGALYLTYLNNVKTLEEETMQQISLLSEQPKQILHVGIVPERGFNFYTKIFPVLLKDFPTVKFSIQNDYSSELEAQFLSNKLDLCVLSGPLDRAIKNHLILDNEEILVVCSKKCISSSSALSRSYATDQRALLSLFAQKGFVVLNRGQRMRQVADHIFKREHIQAAYLVEVFNQNTAMQMVASSEDLVTFVPESTLRKSSIQNDVCAFHIGYIGYTWDLILLYSGEEVRKIAEAIVKKYQEMK